MPSTPVPVDGPLTDTTTVRLKDGLAVLWRAPGAVQIGLDPRCRVVLDGLSEAEQALLDRLPDAPRLRELIERGRRSGVPTSRVRGLVARLRDAGVLAAAPSSQKPASWSQEADAAYWVRAHDEEPPWQRREAATVAVLGVDRLGMLIASGVAACGVGTVLLSDPAPVRPGDVAPGAFDRCDVGRSRGVAGAERLRRGLPAVRTDAPAGVRPDMCVLVEHGVASPVRARPLVREDVAHLSVVVGEIDVVVGPLVVPGTGPCLRCLDLHRCDDDARWPALATQVAAVPPEGVESYLAPLAAAVAVGQVLAHLDGRRPVTAGATLELDALSPVPRQRAWTAHADCGCAGVALGAQPSTARGSSPRTTARTAGP